mgnify:CR=1 FL=1
MENVTYHFTYCNIASADLQQGDILYGCEDILRTEYPNYLQENFTHFIILTQSCDLVRRDGKPCESKYIKIAPVVPLKLIFFAELEKYQSEFERTALVCKESIKQTMDRFLERLMNNNDSQYFYLHEEPLLNFPQKSCAVLRHSITLDTYKYYDDILKSRIFTLNGVFQAKLGWLVGNIYSRIATEDWYPDHVSKEDFFSMRLELLDGFCKWVEDKKLKEAKKTVPASILEAKDTQKLWEHIQNTPGRRAKEMIVGRILEILAEKGKLANADDEKKLKNRLIQDPIFSSLNIK